MDFTYHGNAISASTHLPLFFNIHNTVIPGPLSIICIVCLFNLSHICMVLQLAHGRDLQQEGCRVSTNVYVLCTCTVPHGLSQPSYRTRVSLFVHLCTPVHTDSCEYQGTIGCLGISSDDHTGMPQVNTQRNVLVYNALGQLGRRGQRGERENGM